MTYKSVNQSQILKVGHRIGVGGQKNKVIFNALADRLGVPRPTSKDAGRALVRAYIDNLAVPLSKARGRTKALAVPKVATDQFLMSYEWRQLRMRVLVARGAVCECCGASAARDKARMNVDHIKPRRLFPDLALVESNLQVLCDVCNHGKGNWDQTDWRKRNGADRLPEDVRPFWG